jgi:hypothetical protein
MAFTEIDIHRIKKEVGGLCTEKTPAHIKDKLRYEYDIEKQNVIIYEVRPAWDNKDEIIRMPFAKLSYVVSRRTWKLYWKRASGKWERYEPKETTKELHELVQAIKDDAYGCFFG